jgi:hypothetical protein
LTGAEGATRAEVLATLAIVTALAAVVVGRAVWRRVGPHPSAEECSALLDRYVEHLVAAEGGPLPVPAQALSERRARARAKAERDAEFARCPIALTRDEATCALGAHSADEFERCLP